MKKNIRGFGFYLVLILALLLILFLYDQSGGETQTNFGYQTMIERIEEVVRVEVDQLQSQPAGRVTVIFEKGESQSFYVSSVPEFEEDMKERGIMYAMSDVQQPSILLGLLPWILMIGATVFLFVFILNQSQGGGGAGRAMAFGKSKAKMVLDDKKKITFEKVAGLKEEKEQLEEVVDFLKHKEKYIGLGARIPKGVLLVGPPGTGKTLLARAVAGEAAVPYFSISGSDFVEMFVGVGASRVRDLFEQAKKNAPCIVFIDEIDAVGRRRGAGLGGGHDEREQTLNQLLVEMDGFGENEGVIVLAATNRVDILDPAIMRPGRFDRKVFVGRPDVKGREEILHVHAKGKPLSDTVNLKEVAQTTAGFTGADLENLLNEGAIYAARSNSKVIKQEHIRLAFIKVAIGTEKKSRLITDKEKKITAYHEAGHAIIQHLLPDADKVHSISIIPTGMAGGYTMSLPEKDNMYRSINQMEQEIVILLGGRAAEKIVLKDVTTGASNDIERATKMARSMVVRYGMSDVLGPIQFGDDDNEVFIGRDWGHKRNYGENVAGIIDTEIRRIVEDGYEKAIDMLNANIDKLHLIAQELIKSEKITGEEFVALFEGRSKATIIDVDAKEVDTKQINPESENPQI